MLQNMQDEFILKTNIFRMNDRAKNLDQRFIHIPSSLQMDLDKKFKKSAQVFVAITQNDKVVTKFVSKIARINNRKRNIKIYYIRIPAWFCQFIDKSMFERESIQVTLQNTYI